MHDLVIRGGTVVDGTGAPARTADVAVSGGTVTEVGRVGGRARRAVDADGLLVTPGFVDIHTHFDGQVTWDDDLSPSCWHGVTTAILGNCGGGFAPVRRDGRTELIELMESSRRWARSSARAWRRGRSASRPAGPPATATCGATRCPAPTRPRTSSPPSWPSWTRWARACSRWSRPGSAARSPATPRGPWSPSSSGWCAGARPAGGPSRSW